LLAVFKSKDAGYNCELCMYFVLRVIRRQRWVYGRQPEMAHTCKEEDQA